MERNERKEGRRRKEGPEGKGGEGRGKYKIPHVKGKGETGCETDEGKVSPRKNLAYRRRKVEGKGVGSWWEERRGGGKGPRRFAASKTASPYDALSCISALALLTDDPHVQQQL